MPMFCEHKVKGRSVWKEEEEKEEEEEEEENQSIRWMGRVW